MKRRLNQSNLAESFLEESLREMILKRLISIALSVGLMVASVGFAGSLSDGTSAVLGIDFETGDISYQHNIDEVIAIASTTKLMTYLVVMDEISASESYSLSDEIVIDKETSEIGGSTFALEEGEVFTIEQLLNALLIVSGNDACYALAKHFAEDEYGFVEKMNYKASELGFENAVYYTSSGLPDSQRRENVMTARELYQLSVYIVEKYPEVLEITSKEMLSYQERQYSELNTNPLLGKMPGVDGLKTGFTNRAGRCIVSTGVQADGNRVVAIVMGTANEEVRAEKAKRLMESTLGDYNKRKLYSKFGVIDTVSLKESKYKSIEISPIDDVEIFIQEGQEPTEKISIDGDIKAPLKRGDIIGQMVLEYGDNLRKIDITVAEDISRFKMARIIVSNFISSIF